MYIYKHPMVNEIIIYYKYVLIKIKILKITKNKWNFLNHMIFKQSKCYALRAL